MAGKRALEQQIAALDMLRTAPEDELLLRLRKTLAKPNNFLVAKASDLAREFQLASLIPDLLTAFDRFLENPEKTDPQCWAKNAISRALAAMEHQDPEIFLRGIRHIQLEAVWGGRSDTAGTLRATCALALVQCRSLQEPEVLGHLVELLADRDKSVRVEAVRAIEQVGSLSAALLLRLRAVLGSDEPEVLGACYAGVLRIEGGAAISWVRRFLDSAGDTAAEAGLAIAGSHSLEGFTVLREHFENAKDPWWRSVLLSAIALTRQEAAQEFLFGLIRSESLSAEAAIETILRAAPSAETLKHLEELVARNPRLARAFATHRGEHP